MKAFLSSTDGTLDGFQPVETAVPTPQENEVLVQIRAASVNPLDLARVGNSLIVRFFGWLLRAKSAPPGVDIAGEVTAVGSGVTRFKPGDAVFGWVAGGGFAEYAIAREKALVLKPDTVSYEAAAAVPVAAFTALQGLRDKGQIKPGQKVLINGASGGVGTFAVQIAKSYGAEVTAVCSTGNVDRMRSIGADFVIDYTKEDFSQNGRRYDLIFDTVTNHSVSDYLRALNPGGICALVGFLNPMRLFQMLILGALVSRFSSKHIGFMGIARNNQADLDFIRGLLQDGKVAPVIDKTYPLSQTADALRYLQTKHARGKVIVTVEQSQKT